MSSKKNDLNFWYSEDEREITGQYKYVGIKDSTS